MMQRMKGTLRPGRKAGVLALAVLLLTCVLMAGAVSADGIWDGTTTTPVSPSGNTYFISSGSELAWVAKEVNSGNNFQGMTLELTENIDLDNHEWTPIGSADNEFAGIFDGKNYTISNLKITKDLENSVSNNYVGLFGHTVSPSVIKNIKIQNVNVSGSLYVGGVVGKAHTGEEIRNCHISGDIHIKGSWYVGGIGGNGYMGVIADCSVEGKGELSEIRGIEGHIGGIWGFRGERDQKIINCRVKNIAISGADRTGGISGILHYGNAIEECIVTDVTVSISSDDADTVGGIAGTYLTEPGSTQTISGCIFDGKVYKQGVLISEGDRILGGAWNGDPYPRTDVTIRENIFNGIPVDDRPAKIDGVYYDTLDAALDAATDGDIVTLLQDVSLTNALTIDKAITLTATDSADKPTLTVPQVLIAAPGVTLDNLKIQQTAGTNTELYTVRVTSAVTEGQITITDSEILPVNNGRGFAINAGAQFDLIFTGNTVKAANEGDQLAFAIYIEAYNKGFVFEKNIIPMCSKAQLGVDLRVNEVSMDISKNYWGGAGPNLELHVDDGQTLNLAGQNVYYTELNDDGTIDEGSLVYGEGALQDLIDNEEDGAVLELAGGEYSCPTGLVIDKNITITAADPSNMPKIVISGSPNNGHVGSVQIGVKNVELSYLSFTTDQDQLFYVQGGSDPTKTVTIDHCYAKIPEGTGHFYGDYAGTECNIVLTNNKVESEGTPNLAIYFNVNAKSTYTIEKNIFPKCNHKQVGITVYSDDHAPVDISENYWGGSEPTFECFVMEGNEFPSAEADDAGLSGQDTYYSRLNSDGTIDESSLVSPVEPTPQPTPLPPSYSSGDGNMDNAYRVLFNDGSTTLSVQTDLSSGDKLTKPETPVKDGYTFAGWYKDSACTQAWDFETGIPGDMTLYAKWTAAGSSGETEATATPTATAVTTPQPTKTQTAAATTSAPQATTAAGVSPTLTQAPAPVAGALFGLLAAGVLLRRRFQ